MASETVVLVGKERRTQFWRFKREYKIIILAVMYLAFFGMVLTAKVYTAVSQADMYSSDYALTDHDVSFRSKRDVHPGLYSDVGDGVLDDGPPNCTERSIYHFPPNFMSLNLTQAGGVAAHIALSLYMFGALAIVCDDYFVASLELICDRLGMQEDVAGATFMAAGSSAPEFFTSVIAVFIAESDVGVGTIVGSAVFNILFIISICALFAGMIIYLTWYPLLRDSAFYLASVAALIGTIYDNKVEWWEALIMVIIYAIYIMVMYFNRRIELFMDLQMDKVEHSVKCLHCRHMVEEDNYYEEEERKAAEREKDETTPLLHNGSVAKDDNVYGSAEGNEKVDGEKNDDGHHHDHHHEKESSFMLSHKHDKEEHNIVEMTHEDYHSPWIFPDSWLMRVFWILMLPVKFLLFISIPDCRKRGCWEKLYMVTFLLSIVWIAVFSYIMVWMVTIAGDALDVPDTVMGLTLLAAGTSVPDAMSSLLVARDGLGDMAVSNTLGSNVFDILICLGIPWLMDAAAIKGSAVTISSHGLLFSAIVLLGTVVFILASVHINGWKLTKRLGVAFMLVYFVVITFSCLYELNIFGDVNVPPCPRRPE